MSNSILITSLFTISSLFTKSVRCSTVTCLHVANENKLSGVTPLLRFRVHYDFFFSHVKSILGFVPKFTLLEECVTFVFYK